MKRYSNIEGDMVSNDEAGGWVMWDDVKLIDKKERLIEAQEFIKKSRLFNTKNKISKGISFGKLAEMLVEFSMRNNK